jgi:hypothetical protein
MSWKCFCPYWNQWTTTQRLLRCIFCWLHSNNQFFSNTFFFTLCGP